MVPPQHSDVLTMLVDFSQKEVSDYLVQKLSEHVFKFRKISHCGESSFFLNCRKDYLFLFFFFLIEDVIYRSVVY